MRRQMLKAPHYSIIPFLLSLSAYSELTEIKNFTGINLAQSLHVCKPWCKRVLVWYPIAPLPPVSKTYRTVNFVNRYTPNIYIYIYITFFWFILLYDFNFCFLFQIHPVYMSYAQLLLFLKFNLSCNTLIRVEQSLNLLPAVKGKLLACWRQVISTWTLH